MNIEIVGILLERLTALAVSLRTDPTLLAPKVIRRGLEVMEYGAEKKVKKASPISASQAYIQEHWMEQTDPEMAAVLGIQERTLRQYRSSLGLKRKDPIAVPVANPTTNGAMVMSLSDEAKAEVTAHPEMSHEDLAARFKVTPGLVKGLRITLAKEFLKNGAWQKETDGAIGARFGLHTPEIWKLRKASDLLRLRGSGERESSPAKYIALLGGAEKVKEALTNGGKTIVDLFHDKGITTAKLSRERMRQIVGTIGLTGDESQHTSLWYANRFLGSKRPELAREMATTEGFRKQLAKSGGCLALSKKLGVTEHHLRVIAEKIGLVSEEDKMLMGGMRPEMVPIICSYCSATFYRPKTQVEREKRAYPDRILHFCNKSHQGFYVAEHYGIKPGEVRVKGRRKSLSP